MDKGKDVTETGKSVVLALADENKSVRYNSEKVGRSKTAVHNVISASNSGRSGFGQDRNRKYLRRSIEL